MERAMLSKHTSTQEDFKECSVFACVTPQFPLKGNFYDSVFVGPS